MMQYQKFEVQTSHIMHETEVITTKREKNPANLQGKVSGGERKKMQVIIRKCLEGNNLWNFEIIFWSTVSFHFSISPTFHYIQYLSLKCPNTESKMNFSISLFSSVAVFETAFSFMWVIHDGLQTARLDLNQLLEIQ